MTGRVVSPHRPSEITWTLAVDLERARVGDRVLDRDLDWHDIFYIRMSACGRYKIAYADNPYQIRWFYRHGNWWHESQSFCDILAIRFAAPIAAREVPLPIDPPGERQIFFASPRGFHTRYAQH